MPVLQTNFWKQAAFTRIASFFFLITPVLKAQPQSIVLARPTDTSITASIMFKQVATFYIEYGIQPGDYPHKSPTYDAKLNTPSVVELTSLQPNTRYFYRLRYRLPNASTFEVSPEYTFHTQRSIGSTFRFTVEADEHLYDKKGVRSLYKIDLQNQAKANPDFMISLGDTFGDDHTPTTTTSADMNELHKDYLQYLGANTHSIPFFFVLGNHEGENGYYLKQTPPNNIAVYGTAWRKFYYPNPVPNHFYSGNTVPEAYGIGLPENYYAFTWGDALFVMLDVYRHVSINEKPQSWDWTLGETQYRWFKSTLENSKAKYKFVFAHHLRGQGRGAAVMVKGFEWGGYNNAGTYQFDTMRPNWGLPIHQLMVKYGVNIFFQGHDHLYAREKVDNIMYQEMPMPSDSTYQIGVLANADAYTGLTLDGSGHLRVTVAPSCTTIEYVRAYLPADTISNQHQNGEVADQYSVGTCSSLIPIEEEMPAPDTGFSVFPNPARGQVYLQFSQPVLSHQKVELFNLHGQLLQTVQIQQGMALTAFDTRPLSSGIYLLRWANQGKLYSQKVIVMR